MKALTKEENTMTALEKRYEKAIQDIGGAAGLLNLPEQIKKLLKNVRDQETKVRLLEEIAAELKEGGTA